METNRFALVTGASSGIGLALSRELAKRGYPLIIVSNEEKITAAAADIQREFNVTAIPLCLDLARNDSAQTLFNYCEENNIQIGILINNAGIFFFRDVNKTQVSLIEKIISLHILTPTLLIRLFADRMIEENSQCHILNIASIAASMMMPGITLYSATKSYLRCFSRAMRNEVFDKNISITTVSPGAVATGLYGLAPRYMRLGLFLGIIMTPEKLAAKAINQMFRKKTEYIPGGLINRLFILIVKSIPQPLVRHIKKKIDIRMKQ